jgi:hypothetical protein
MVMARAYKPSSPFTVAMKLLIPEWVVVKGVRKKIFPEPETVNQVFFGSFKTYGGTEGWNNDVYMVEDTATIDAWYDPNVTADCRIYLCGTGETWDIVGRPENIDMRNQYLQIKVKRVGGQP